jgi:hypothetical protein
MKDEAVQVGDRIEPKPGIFMPYWNPGATVVKVGTPKALENEPTKTEGGDWIIISSYGGWLPRRKFKKHKYSWEQ